VTQGALPYIDAADRYVQLLGRMVKVLVQMARQAEIASDVGADADESPSVADDLLDVDAVVARRCAERARPVPDDVEEKVCLQLEALEAFLQPT
jgi:hypothetical protein